MSGIATSFSSFESFGGDKRTGLVVLPWDGILDAAGVSSRKEALHQFLLSGGTVLLVPSPRTSAFGKTKPDWLNIVPEDLQASSNGLALTVLDKDNPILDDMRDEKGVVALRNVKVFRFAPLRVTVPAAALLGLEDGTVALASQTVGQGLLLASGMAFDPAWSTLPLKPAFVALAQGMVLNHSGAQASIASMVAGDALTGTLAATDPLMVKSLGGSPMDWKGPAGQFTTFPRVGVYALQTGKETRWVGVRSSEKESRRKFMNGDTLPALAGLTYAVDTFSGSAGMRATFRRQERSLDLSLPMLLLAFAFLALEGWLANPPPLKPRTVAAASPHLVPAK